MLVFIKSKIKLQICNIINEYTEDNYTYPNDILSKSYNEISSVIPSDNRISIFNKNLLVEIRKKLSDERYRKTGTYIHTMENFTQSCDFV